MVKITDVAKEAGVSTSTVSRILNRDEHFSASTETIKKVHQAVEVLGYTPLRKRSSSHKKAPAFKVALAITISKEGESNDPYWTSIRLGIETQAKESNVEIDRLIRIDHNMKPEEFKEMDGVIVLGAILPRSLEIIGLDPQKTVLINNVTYDVSQFDRVSSDLVQITRQNLQLLQSLGHKRIGFIGGTEGAKDVVNGEEVILEDARKKAYEAYMNDEGLLNRRDIYIGDWNSINGHRLMKEAIEKGDYPTAFLVGSDPMSMGALHAIREFGLRVPEDISIISYDDIEASAFMNPPLSSVRLHTEEVGKQAVHLMVDRLKGREVPIQVTVQSKLVVRESYQALSRERRP